MHAVVARSTLHDVEKGKTFLRENAAQRVAQVPGFVSAHWVRVSEDTGTSMLVFETEEGARMMAEQMRNNPPPADAVTINSIEVGEVVHSV